LLGLKSSNRIIKLALGVEYNGSLYSGWQLQSDTRSLQGELERALSEIADHPIKTYCAGRTDSKVHSIGQVVHFETKSIRKEVAWTIGVNSFLPKDISVTWVRPVVKDFHARFSAISRTYRYIIYNASFRSAMLYGRVVHFRSPLDTEKMHRSGQYLLGEKDFSSFRSSKCQSRTAWRKITSLQVKCFSPYIILEVKANSFLHHMVRNIAGSLIEIGRGNKGEEWIQKLLALKDRSKAPATAPPEGLYLVSVDYPRSYNLPEMPVRELSFLDKGLMLL
jgi:tRNA pseudouridine38-40 synthase